VKNEFFSLERWEVTVRGSEDRNPESRATVKIRTKKKEIFTAAEGVGPVDALAKALYKGLRDFYPEIDEIKLIDYIVNIENSQKGTAAKVKVSLKLKKGEKEKIFMSTSANILEASLNALVEGLVKFLSESSRKGGPK
jgi:2-isopropylmalate synthase